jgi:hypothetical protein
VARIITTHTAVCCLTNQAETITFDFYELWSGPATYAPKARTDIGLHQFAKAPTAACASRHTGEVADVRVIPATSESELLPRDSNPAGSKLLCGVFIVPNTNDVFLTKPSTWDSPVAGKTGVHSVVASSFETGCCPGNSSSEGDHLGYRRCTPSSPWRYYTPFH